MGVVRFSEEHIRLMRAFQKKYETDFVGFYKALPGYYIGSKAAIKYSTGDEVRRVRQVISGIEKMLSPTGEVSKSDIANTYKLMDAVERDIQFYIDQSKIDPTLNDNLEKIFVAKRLSPVALHHSQRVMHGRLKKIETERPSIIQRWKQFSPETYEFVSGAGKAILGGSLGFAAPLAETAISSVSGIYKRYRERKLSLERQAIIGAIAPVNAQNPEGFAKMHRGLFGLGKADVPTNVGSGYMADPAGRRALGGGDAYARSGVGGMVRSGWLAKEIGAGLFAFFSIQAYRAKWTKELIESISGISKNKDKGTKGGKGLFETIWDGIWGIIKVIGAGILSLFTRGWPLLLGVAIAIFAWKLGRWLDKKFDLGKPIADAGKGEVTGWGKLSPAVWAMALGWKYYSSDTPRQAAKLNPRMKRQMELQRQGLSPRDAASVAWAESKGVHIDTDRGTDTTLESLAQHGLIQEGGNRMSSYADSYSSVFKPQAPVTSVPSASMSVDKNSFNVEGVPIQLDAEGNLSKESLDNIYGVLEKIANDLYEQGKNTLANPSSGREAWNTRNPMLSNLNAGAIDVE
jgi:hypothetical protein